LHVVVKKLFKLKSDMILEFRIIRYGQNLKIHAVSLQLIERRHNFFHRERERGRQRMRENGREREGGRQRMSEWQTERDRENYFKYH